MFVAFLLLAVVAQASLALVARNSAAAAAAAVARRASRPGASPASEQAALAAVVARTVPGAVAPAVRVWRDDEQAHAEVAFTWRAPAAGWVTVRMRSAASAPLMVPP